MQHPSCLAQPCAPALLATSLFLHLLLLPLPPRRQFVKCPNEGCGYFKWTDELGADGPAPAGGAGYGGYGGDAGHGSPSAKRRITGYTGAQASS